MPRHGFPASSRTGKSGTLTGLAGSQTPVAAFALELAGTQMSGRDIQLMIGIAGNTQPSPATT